MGGALLDGWMAAGWQSDDVRVVVRRDAQARELRDRHGIANVPIHEAAQSDLIVLAVKPDQFESICAALEPAPGAVVISVAAGVTVAQLESWLPEGTAVARVMPNTGSFVGQGMSGVVRGTHVSDEQLAAVTGLFDGVGATLVLPEEQFDALTAISGSGLAYVFYVAEAMIEAGVHEGLSREQSAQLVNQTFLGASTMLATSGKSATTLREEVTFPAGTTASALRRLDDHGVRAAFLDAVAAARAKAARMGNPSE
ncbi:MAG: pyrroline-5-carboxylate reductase [Propionibacterium sp.]|nr:pyrroline-5-carboxylate reductase [Propionibacterium sp.]